MAIALVASYGNTWGSGLSSETASVTVASGDCLVVLGVDEAGGDTLSISGGGLTYTLQQSKNDGVCSMYLWTVFPSSGQTYTLTVNNNLANPAASWGFVALRYSGVASIGANILVEVANTSTPQTSITNTSNNSTIVVALQWANSTGTTITWLTSSAGTFTQITPAPGQDIFAGHYLNAGSSGAKTIGAASSDYGSNTSDIGAIELVAAGASASVKQLIIESKVALINSYVT